MEDVGEHKNLGVGVVGNLKEKKSLKVKKKPKAKKITKKKLKEGTVNGGTRTAKAEYLRSKTKTVGIMNAKGEYEIKLTKDCGEVLYSDHGVIRSFFLRILSKRV